MHRGSRGAIGGPPNFPNTHTQGTHTPLPSVHPPPIPSWTYTAHQHPCPSPHTHAQWSGHLARAKGHWENEGLPPSRSAPFCWTNKAMGSERRGVVARVLQDKICATLEAEPRTGSPVSPGNRDSHAGGTQYRRGCGPRICCPGPPPPPSPPPPQGWRTGPAARHPAAATPSLPSH